MMTLNEQKLYDFIKNELNNFSQKGGILYREPFSKDINDTLQSTLYNMGYQLLGYVTNDKQVDQTNIYLQELNDYFNLNIQPPKINISDKGLKRKILTYWTKLKPTQEEIDKSFEGFFQFFNYSDLFILNRKKYVNGDKSFVLKILNINMSLPYIDLNHVFRINDISHVFSVLGYSIFPSRFKTDEVEHFLAHLTPYFETSLNDPTQFNFYKPIQSKILDFIQETIPAQDWHLFAPYYLHLCTPLDSNVTSLFTAPKLASSTLNLEHAYISKHFPNLLVKSDIHLMNSYFCELLLTSENAQLLNISNIVTLGEAHHGNKDQTQFIIYSANETPVNIELFSDIYLNMIELFAEKKVNNKQVKIEDCTKLILHYRLQYSTDQNATLIKRPKI